MLAEGEEGGESAGASLEEVLLAFTDEQEEDEEGRRTRR